MAILRTIVMIIYFLKVLSARMRLKYSEKMSAEKEMVTKLMKTLSKT